MNLLKKFSIAYDIIRGYNYEDPEKNGEYLFIKNLLRRDNLTVFDVGANIGTYTDKLLQNNFTTNIHTFEPVNFTFNKMKERINAAWPGANVQFNKLGMSNRPEKLDINLYWDDGGANSLYFHEYHANLSNNVKKETIELTTIDEYIERNSISKIDFCKIDIEGHESKCIEGAINALQNGIILNIQFEYGEYWKLAGLKLKTTFELLSDHHFELYRLAFFGKIPVRTISPFTENFKTANYLAILKQ